jgi:hypothetical protein
MKTLATIVLACSPLAAAEPLPTSAHHPPPVDQPPIPAIADRASPPEGMRMPRPAVAAIAIPAREVAALAKTVAGSYRCKGVTMNDDGSSMPLQATLAIKLDLAGGWILAAFVTAEGVRSTEYRTFDGVAKQWTRIQLDSASAHVISTSLGEKAGTWDWEGTRTSPLGAVRVRDHEQIGKDAIKVWGEALVGGSWDRAYEASCKR